ncbi:MAG: DUF418 domain-containing protein [Isosphaeraceae bacterium]
MSDETLAESLPTIDSGGAEHGALLVEAASEGAIPAEPTPEPPPSVGPVAEVERVNSVDVVRGVALLGILAMNIVNFGWPGPAYSNPTKGAVFNKLDWGLWAFNHVVFDTKMMSLFSMLFGAGLVLMSDRATTKGQSFGWFYYRRVLWLLAIGLCHAYLIWSGDILVLYAQCGLLLYPLRKLPARSLLILGVCFQLLLIPLIETAIHGIRFMRATAARVEAMELAGETPRRWEAKLAELDKKAEKNMKPDEAKAKEEYDKEMTAYRGGYAGIVKHRAKNLFMEHTVGFLLGGWWFIGGRMLIGMALMKWGVFAASRSRAFYIKLLAFCYGVGIPLVAYDTFFEVQHNFSGKAGFFGRGIYLNFYGGMFLAVGHAALVMLIYKAGLFQGLTRRLGAVGRMALSNYLFDSIVCTTIFYGYGLAFFGTASRTYLYLVVLAIWTFQLLVSPIWLEVYKFGPAEWLWRSLTYGKPQPMRRGPKVEAVAA